MAIAVRAWRFLSTARSWDFLMRRPMARHPPPSRCSTLRSMPWLTWKRDTRGSGGAVQPAAKAATPAERGRAGSALRTGGIAAAVSGVVVFGTTFFLQWLPLIDNPVSSGLGAAVGAFATGTVLSFRGRR